MSNNRGVWCKVFGDVVVTDQGEVLRGGLPISTHRGGPRGRYAVVSVEGKKWYVHRLILTAFRGPPKEGQEASHLNDQPRDNRLANLVWETHSQNCARRAAYFRNVSGARNPNAKLSEFEVEKIYAQKGLISASALSRMLGNVSDVTIGNIWSGRQWSSVTGAK